MFCFLISKVESFRRISPFYRRCSRVLSVHLGVSRKAYRTVFGFPDLKPAMLLSLRHCWPVSLVYFFYSLFYSLVFCNALLRLRTHRLPPGRPCRLVQLLSQVVCHISRATCCVWGCCALKRVYLLTLEHPTPSDLEYFVTIYQPSCHGQGSVCFDLLLSKEELIPILCFSDRKPVWITHILFGANRAITFFFWLVRPCLNADISNDVLLIEYLQADS